MKASEAEALLRLKQQPGYDVLLACLKDIEDQYKERCTSMVVTPDNIQALAQQQAMARNLVRTVKGVLEHAEETWDRQREGIVNPGLG